MGRSTLAAQLMFGLVAFAIGLMLFPKFALPVPARLPFARGVALAVGVSLLLGTVWAFVAARRRALIGSMTVFVAFSVWAILSGLIMLDWWLHPA